MRWSAEFQTRKTGNEAKLCIGFGFLVHVCGLQMFRLFPTIQNIVLRDVSLDTTVKDLMARVDSGNCLSLGP